MRRFLIIILGLLCVGLGAVSLPLPLPTGALLLTIGFGLLMLESRRLRLWFLGIRRRRPWLHEKIAQVEHYLPDQLARALNGRGRPRI